MSELPASAHEWFEGGNTLSREGRWADAVAQFRRVLEAAPAHEWALNNLGYCLFRAGDHEEAVFRLRRAVTVAPGNPTAHANLVAALEAAGRGTEALPFRRRLADLRPKVAAHAFDLANALLGGGRAEEAIGYYQRALAVDPGYTPAVCNYLLALNYSGRWPPEAVAAEHVRLAVRWAPRRPDPDQFPHTRDPERPLRIGYLSADFAQHPVGKLMIPVLGAHDRRVVTTFAYSDRSDEDDWTRRVQAASGAFRPVGGLPDEELLRLIRGDRVDILVELNGYTGGRTRLGVLAAGAAPVQASFLGYPNTTGTRALDYRITDAFSDPPGPTDRLYTEALVRLDRGFLCHTPPDDLPPLTSAPCVRAGFVAFGSFNNPSKVSEGALGTWVRVLRAVPQSRLVVKYGNKFADEGLRERWRDRFAAAGVDPGRLVFSPAVPGVAGHYRTIGAVDVALDSFPYQGTMTTLETLGMGVPVVTLLGGATASRASSALLMRLGLDEWVARDADEYVAIASGLAADPARLDALRPQVRTRFLESEVCDVVGFVAELEGAYRRMWRRWCEGAPAPDSCPMHTVPGDTGRERAVPWEPAAADRGTVPDPPAGETMTVTLVDGVRVVVPNA
ncbi:MAG TPA: tetratricopeptide repeat protein, partial [Gemmata sp.]